MSSYVRIIGAFLILSSLMLAVAWIYRKGGEEAQHAIERQNNEAARRADEGALDYDACRDAGRVWSFRAGKCIGSPIGGRN